MYRFSDTGQMCGSDRTLVSESILLHKDIIKDTFGQCRIISFPYTSGPLLLSKIKSHGEHNNAHAQYSTDKVAAAMGESIV